MIKRIFDFFATLIALILLSPFYLMIALLIVFTSKGGVFYRQERIGKNRQKFMLYKFRSMQIDSDKKGLLTIGGRDSRTTPVGYYLRKYKLDELPQLFNILKNVAKAEDPEKTYIEEIIPKKLALSLQYIDRQSFWLDLKIIFMTFRKIIR